MQLDERKKKILQAIIRNYLETGEPGGALKAGGSGTGTEYQLCNHDFRTADSPQQNKVYSVVKGGYGTDTCRYYGGGQCHKEPCASCAGGIG